MRLPVAALLSFLMVIPAPLQAQDARQMLDLFRGELDRQLERQRRRQLERDQHHQQQQHQQQYENDWNVFLVQWKACFENKQVAACDAALAFYNLADNDRPRLLEQRQAILNETARREAEAAERDRQARWAAEAAARRVEEERRAQEARLRAEEERRARELVERRAEEVRRARELAERQAEEQRRARELAERRADEQRRAREIAERRAEERRLEELRSYTSALDSCRRFLMLSCDTVITSPLASADDRTRAQQWRAAAFAFASDRSLCQGGSIAACDRALTSPAATDDARPDLEAWRRAASPWYRATNYVHDLSTRSVAAVMALPASTMVTGGIATVLAAIVGVMARRRPVRLPTPQPTVLRSGYGRRLRRALLRALIVVRIWWRDRQTAQPPQPQQPADPIAPPPVVAAATPSRPRDPETALAALELAHAYLVEVEERIQSVFGDPDATTDVLNTLSLASKQLAAAERADPSATFPALLEDGSPITHTQPKLKALALYFEAAARSRDKPRQALSILAQAAALDPDNDRIPFIAGVIHSELLQKGPAIAAFERALALAPHNIHYRKELARAQSISGAEIAYDRAAKGVRTTINLARWAVVLFWVALLGSCTMSVVRINTATSDHEQREALVTLAIVVGILFVIGLFRRSILRMKLWVRENSW